ncbi:hypothetical protein CATMIT_01803 [Catenibacterium mitsuokai DSM 15897]|nr:hypothetical protein CATMIT_01803 [Catenibacterium mitsuokai DSM 15897]
MQAIEERQLLGEHHPRTVAVGVELHRRQRRGQPVFADVHGEAVDDALVVDDVEVMAVEAVDQPGRSAIDDDLFAAAAEVHAVFDHFHAVLAGAPGALGLRIGPGAEQFARAGREPALDGEFAVLHAALAHVASSSSGWLAR